MSRPAHEPSSGFSLLELLIVISIVTLLLQMIFPAVESAREAAWRMSCANNLRDLALAVNNYEATKKFLPRGFRLKPKHNFVQYLLPYIDEQALFDKYDFKKDWDSVQNGPLADTEIATLRCPTAPRKYPYISDYSVCTKIGKELAQELVDEKLSRERSSLTGLLHGRMIKASLATDGLSNTILFCETAGRPDHYVLRRLKKKNSVTGSRWADEDARFALEVRCDGSKLEHGSQLLNCTTNTEIYSFHNHGANFAFADGSSRFIFQDIDPDAMLSLVTASAGD